MVIFIAEVCRKRREKTVLSSSAQRLCQRLNVSQLASMVVFFLPPFFSTLGLRVVIIVEGGTRKSDKRGNYQAVPLLVSGRRNGETGQPWRGIDPHTRGKEGETPQPRFEF